MFKRLEVVERDTVIRQFPHCDPRILHAPGECEFCDKHKDWQELRLKWGIAFTGFEPEGTELPCPADHARGDAHTKWYGNVATKNVKFDSKDPGGFLDFAPFHNHGQFVGDGDFVVGCPGCTYLLDHAKSRKDEVHTHMGGVNYPGCPACGGNPRDDGDYLESL